MQRAKFSGVDDDQSPEVQYLLRNLKLEELLPKARDAVNLFFLNIKTNPQAAESIHETSLLRPVWRAIAKKEDIVEQGGLKSVVSLLSSQTTALQVQAAKALGSLAADARGPVAEALRALNVHITAVKLIGTPVTQELLVRLLEILYHLAKIESCQMPLIRVRCVAGIVALLDAPGPKVHEVEKLCFSILAALAEGAETLDIIAKERGLEVSVIAVTSNDIPIRFEALKVISGFSKDPTKGRAHLAKTNVANLLFQLLQDKSKPLDQKQLSKILGIIVRLSDDVECAAQIEASGIVLMLAMLIIQAGALQEKALKAVLALSVHEKIKVPILQTGVVSSLSKLALLPQSRILATSILSNLASEAVFMREMSVKGIVELVNSMPPAPVLVQRIIARIVKSAARYDDVKSGLVEFGAVSIFTGVMNMTKDDFVLAEVVDVLAVLTKNERIRKVIIACGHTVRIVSLLGSHLFERLELPIITVISNLTLEAQGVEAVLRLNGAFRVFAKMAIWHENQELRTHALLAVSNLLVNDANRTEFIALGGLDAVLYLLYEVDNEAIQTSALTVVAKLAKSISYQETLMEEDIIEHLKELKKQPRFVTPVAGSPLIAAFRDLVMALKASGASAPNNSDRPDFWIYLRKGDYVRALKVSTDITLDDLIPMIKTAYKVPDSDNISLMFKDAGYPVVLHSSDELLLFFMNYQDNKRIPLIVYDGEVPEEAIMIETPAIPAPPAPPPPPPGALDKYNRPGHNLFAAPAYLQRHELGDTKMTSKPQNALLPENLMSEILNAVKRREEGKPLLHSPINHPGGGDSPLSPRNLGSPQVNSRSEEKMGEREWFRHVGKWYRVVHQTFAMHPILVRIIFDIIDSKQDHKSFARCYEAAMTNMPHVLPHMQHQFSQDDLADSLLRIGFNVKSSKSGIETRYEFIVRPQSLAPELLLKAILLFTKQQ